MKSILAFTFLSGVLTSMGALISPVAIAQNLPSAPTSAKSWNRPTLRISLPTTATQLEFSREGDRLLTTGATAQSVELWNLTTGKKQSTFPVEAGVGICNAALSANGEFVAALTYAQETPAASTKRKIALRMWNLKTGRSLWNIPIQDRVIQGEQLPSCQVEFSPNSQLVATSISGAADKAQTGVRVWNVPQGTLQQVTGSRVNAIEKLAFSPDSSLLGFTTNVNSQSQLHLWNLRDRKLQANLKGLPVQQPAGLYFPDLFNFAFSPSQQDVIAYTFDNELISRLYRWQTSTGKLLGTRDLPIDRQDGLFAISADGQTYVYGGQVSGYHIGNLQSKRTWRFAQGLDLSLDQSKAVAISSDGQQVAISYDQAIVILR